MAEENKGTDVPNEKTYTEEEFNRKLTSEVDRRVESGIQKGLETQKQKWQQEFEERAKLSAEELAKKQIEEQSKTLTAKEREIAKKANKIDAREMLSEANVPKAHYSKFLDVLVSDDAELTQTNVKNFVDMFNATKQDIETRLKTELSNIPKPNQGEDKKLTKEDFQKMSYGEMIKLKNENPELYKEFMK